MLAAVLATEDAGDDIVRLLARVDAVAAFLDTPDGRDLLAASKRAANILRIEDKRDGPHEGAPDPALFTQDEERALLFGDRVSSRARRGGSSRPNATPRR